MRRTNLPTRGFSLVEASIASAVLGVLVVGSLQSLGAIGRTRASQAHHATGEGLAIQLAAEIRALPYSDPSQSSSTIGIDGDDSGAGRTGWDDVDDYDGLTEKPPATRAGVAQRAEAGWSRSVRVVWVTVDTSNGKIAESATETGIKQVTVTTQLNEKPMASSTFLRSRAWDEVHP